MNQDHCYTGYGDIGGIWTHDHSFADYCLTNLGYNVMSWFFRTINYLRLRIVDWSRFPLASSPPGICSPKYFSATPTTAPFVQPGALCWPQSFLYLVLVVGLEPTRYCYQQILSLPRLPIPSYQHLGLKSRISGSETPNGTPDGAWTHDSRLKRPLLYQLSYWRISGGATGTRTPDFLLAKQTLYQLSYDPINQVLSKAAFPYLSLTNCRKKSRPLILEWSCWRDSNPQPTHYKCVALPIVLQQHIA